MSGGLPDFSPERTRRIVAGAEAVVRATAVDSIRVREGGRGAPRPHVVFAVDEVLRGAEVPDTLHFYGLLESRDSFRPPGDDGIPYLSYFRWYAGNCMAYSYRHGGEYLLLLRESRRAGEADPYWVILAPTNDQIRGADDPWVAWVRDVLRGIRSDSAALDQPPILHSIPGAP